MILNLFEILRKSIDFKTQTVNNFKKKKKSHESEWRAAAGDLNC